MVPALARPWDCKPDRYAMRLSGGLWKPFPHLMYLANVVTQAILVGGGRVVVNLPPRYGKSELVSFWLPLWFLDNFPERRVIEASYQADIAIGYGRRVRNELDQNPLCRTRLTEDSQAAGRFHTEKGGAMFCAGVDGPLMGRGGDLAIFDDPHKSWEEAFSPLMRDKTEEWFWSTLYTRCEPGATVIVVQARFHPDDLSGRLERQGGWTVVRLPELAEAGDPLGRALGAPLCPERFDLPAIAERRTAIGEARWSAMYQQAPTGYGTGRLYGNFSSRNLDAGIVLDPALPLHLAVDFNIRPGMHLEVGQYRDLDRTFVVTDEIHAEALDLSGAMDRFDAWVRARGGFEFPELHVFGDATGHSRSITVTRSCYDLIAARLTGMRIPYRIRVPRRQPAIRDSVDALNDALLGTDGVPRLFVHPRCRRLVTDFQELQRSPDGLIDKHNLALSHASDATRYWCAFIKPAGTGGDERPRRRGRIFIGPPLFP